MPTAIASGPLRRWASSRSASFRARRSPPSSGSTRLLLAALAGAAVGLGGEWAFYGWSNLHWLPDIAAGWSLIGAGLAARRARPESRVGPLLAAAGFAWFVPNF